MTQLILDGIVMPEVNKNKYRAEETVLSSQVEMISGRIVSEERGRVWQVSSSYNYLYDPDGTKLPAILSLLRGRASFPVTFLPDNGSSRLTSNFIATSVTSPSLSFSAGGVPYWTGLAFTLREVRPHD